MRNIKGYQSNSRIGNRAVIVSSLWSLAGLSALVWACISHPPVLLLFLPLMAGFFAFTVATRWKSKQAVGFLEATDMIALTLVVFFPLGLIEIALVISNLGEVSFWKGVLPGLVIVALLWFRGSNSNNEAECYLCFTEHPLEGQKKCPSCEIVFKGGGWTGLKAHWNEHHASELSYNDLWGSLCDQHLKKDISYIDPSIETYVPKFRRKYSTQEFKNQKLIELNLPKDIVTSLVKSGVTHIYQLIKLTEDECLSIRGIATKTMDIIKGNLLMHNLTFGVDQGCIESMLPLDVADNSIGFLGLSKRTKNLLKPHNVETIKDLLDLGEAQIYHLPRLGMASFDEIAKALVGKNIWATKSSLVVKD
jgi:hypothetical protein